MVALVARKTITKKGHCRRLEQSSAQRRKHKAQPKGGTGEGTGGSGGESRKWLFSRLTFLQFAPIRKWVTTSLWWRSCWQFGALLLVYDITSISYIWICFLWHFLGQFELKWTWRRGCRLEGKGKIQCITLWKHRCCKLSFMGVLDTLSGLRLRRSGQRSGFEQQLNLSSAEWAADVVENQDLQGGVPSQQQCKWFTILLKLPSKTTTQVLAKWRLRGHGGSQTTSKQSGRWRTSLKLYIYSS